MIEYWRKCFFSPDDAICLAILRQLEDGQVKSFVELDFRAPRFYERDSDYLRRMAQEGLIGETLVPPGWRIRPKGKELLERYRNKDGAE